LASLVKYLLDASALYPLILRLRQDLSLYRGQIAVLDLTVYEVGNAIWKEHRRGTIKHPAPVVRMFKEIMKGMERLSIGLGMLEAFDIAAKNNVTFYDASYIYVARKEGLKLVTEDSGLLRFSEAITLEEMLKELKLQPAPKLP
jgi:predicted nucleic acid-binding protein